MLISDPVLYSAFATTLLFVGALNPTSLQEAGATVMLFIGAIIIINKLFKIIVKNKSDSEKIDIIYHQLVRNDIRLIKLCPNYDKCPLKENVEKMEILEKL